MKDRVRKIIEKAVIPFQLIILHFFNIYFSVFKLNKQYIFTIGVDENCRNIFFLGNIFGKENAITVALKKDKFYDDKYDYSIDISNRYIAHFVRLFYGPYILAKLANQSQVFIYIWSTGFCIDREIDYKFLKKKRKKIVCIFLGSDIRSHILKQKYFDDYRLDSNSSYLSFVNTTYEENVKRVAHLADKYADLIFNHPIDQASYLKSNQYVMPYLIEKNMLECFEEEFDKNNNVKIAHAPSNQAGKGTPLVRAAIKKLKLEGYSFDYVELINKPNEVILEELESSHIVLNQFYAFVPGLFGVEAMAKCNAVLMSAKYDGMPDKAKNAWLQTGHWEVYDKLKYLLDNPEKIKEYAQNGYEFVKNNYTEEKVIEYYIDIFYKHKIIDDKNIF